MHTPKTTASEIWKERFFSFSSLNYSGQCFDSPFPLGHEDSLLWDLGSSHCNNCKQSALERLNRDVTQSPVAQTSVNAGELCKIKKRHSRFMMLFFLKALILPAWERERERGRNRTQKGKAQCQNFTTVPGPHWTFRGHTAWAVTFAVTIRWGAYTDPAKVCRGKPFETAPETF